MDEQNIKLAKLLENDNLDAKTKMRIKETLRQAGANDLANEALESAKVRRLKNAGGEAMEMLGENKSVQKYGRNIGNKTGKKVAGKIAKKGAKKIFPALGAIMGIGSMLSAEDASARESAAQETMGDLVGGADALGPQKGSPEAMMEDPNLSQEERARALEMLRQKYDRGE